MNRSTALSVFFSSARRIRKYWPASRIQPCVIRGRSASSITTPAVAFSVTLSERMRRRNEPRLCSSSKSLMSSGWRARPRTL